MTISLTRVAAPTPTPTTYSAARPTDVDFSAFLGASKTSASASEPAAHDESPAAESPPPESKPEASSNTQENAVEPAESSANNEEDANLDREAEPAESVVDEPESEAERAPGTANDTEATLPDEAEDIAAPVASLDAVARELSAAEHPEAETGEVETGSIAKPASPPGDSEERLESSPVETASVDRAKRRVAPDGEAKTPPVAKESSPPAETSPQPETSSLEEEPVEADLESVKRKRATHEPEPGGKGLGAKEVTPREAGPLPDDETSNQPNGEVASQAKVADRPDPLTEAAHVTADASAAAATSETRSDAREWGKRRDGKQSVAERAPAAGTPETDEPNRTRAPAAPEVRLEPTSPSESTPTAARGDSGVAEVESPRRADPHTHRLVSAQDPAAEVERTAQADRVRLVQRVARAFEAAEARGGPVRLRLSPPELGALRIELTVEGGGLSARIEAETPRARSLLMEQLGTLKERLAEQNIRVEQFDVQLSDEGPNSKWQTPQDAPRRQRHSGQSPSPPRDGDGQDAASDEASRPLPALGNEQLDVTI